jgi:glycine cleavage system H protein
MANAEYPKELKYTKDHEWARKAGTTVQIGVTWHAQDALGSVVYVELPKVGASVTAAAQFGVIESTKAVSELFAPISGKVTRVNGR